MKQKKTVKALKAARKLIKYCGKRNCTNCVFCTRISDGYAVCALNFPYCWRKIKGVENEHVSN